MSPKQLAAITRHGQQLLAIFPNATEREPVKLCKKLRSLEAKASGITLRLCNGPAYKDYDEVDKLCDAILDKAHALLGNYANKRCKWAQVPIRINRDPRGYALKIPDKWMTDNSLVLHKDWGGYGIIAPEFDKNGN